MAKQAKPEAKAEEPKEQAKPEAKAEGVEFVYVGDKEKTHCFDTDFAKGEVSLVKSEIGIKKLNNHPHFERK